MKDTTLESLEGRRNRSITPPPDIVKKRQQQAANQAGNQRAHHKPSSNIEHVGYNEDVRKQRQAQFSSRPQESDRQPSGEYRVRSESRERSPRGQRSRYYNQDLGGRYRNEERHDTRPSYAEHPHPYPHPHRYDRAPSEESRRSRNSSRDDDFRRPRYVQSDRSRRSPSPQDYRRETWRISRHEDRQDTRPRYEQHPHPYPHAHTSDRARSDDSRISRNCDREDEPRKPRNVHSEREDIRERSVGQHELESIEVPSQLYGSSRPVRLYSAQNIPERPQNINERPGVKRSNEQSASPKVTQDTSKKLRRSVHDPNRENSPVRVRRAENIDEDAETSPVIVTSRRTVSQKATPPETQEEEETSPSLLARRPTKKSEVSPNTAYRLQQLEVRMKTMSTPVKKRAKILLPNSQENSEASEDDTNLHNVSPIPGQANLSHHLNAGETENILSKSLEPSPQNPQKTALRKDPQELPVEKAKEKPGIQQKTALEGVSMTQAVEKDQHAPEKGQPRANAEVQTQTDNKPNNAEKAQNEGEHQWPSGSFQTYLMSALGTHNVFMAKLVLGLDKGVRGK